MFQFQYNDTCGISKQQHLKMSYNIAERDERGANLYAHKKILKIFKKHKIFSMRISSK